MKFSRKAWLFIIVILLFVIFSFSWIKEKKVKRVNVIFILVDALRYDHLSCYGYFRDTSPNIDNLARSSLLFTQAISPSTVTVVSLPSLFTSTLIRHLVSHWTASLNPETLTLAEVFKREGYRTAFLSGHGIIGKVNGLSRGFDEFLDDRELTAPLLTSKGIQWIENNSSHPFFLYLHYMDVHGPYRPPSPYNSIFFKDRFYKEIKKLPLSQTDEGDNAIPRYIYEDGHEEVGYYIAKYDGGIRFTDEYIGKLLNYLKGSGIYDDTLIVFTADHGEYLGEHGKYFVHGGPPWESVIKVPLLIKLPYQKKGRIVTSMVSTMGIAPTILSFLNFPVPSTMEGKNFVALLKENTEYSSSPVISISGNPARGSWYVSLRTEEFKVIHGGVKGKELISFYNLLEDPGERVDLGEEKIPPGLLSLLKKKEKEMHETLRFSISKLDEETRKRLRSLGYVQ